MNDAAANIGDITSKTGPGSCHYTTAQAGCSYYGHSQPHSVRKAGTTVYCYDANGNMTSRGGSSLLWTRYKLPSRINSGSNHSEFRYGPSRARYKQVSVA